MRERFQLPAPLLRVQYDLLGGHRRTLAACVGFALVLIAGSVGLRRFLHEDPFSTVVGILLNTLLGIEIFILILGGSHAIHRAMLRDFESRMLESHRLAPMSNIAVVLGYVFGPTLQVMLLITISFLFGVALTMLGGFQVADWALGHLVILAGAINVWSAIVLLSLRPTKPMNPSPLLVGVTMLCVALAAFPVLGLMFSMYAVLLGVFVVTGVSSAPLPAIWAVVGISGMFMAIWIVLAAAKYRRPDLPTFNGLRGIIFLFLWLIVATLGLVLLEKVVNAPMGRRVGPPVATQWIGTLIIALIPASIVVLATTESSLLTRRGTSPRDWSDRMPDVPYALFSVLMVCGVMTVLGTPVWTGIIEVIHQQHAALQRGFVVWGLTALVFVLTLFFIRGIFLLVYVPGKSRVLIMSIALAIWLGLAPAIDMARALVAASRDHSQPIFSWLLAGSSAGTLAALWGNIPGVIIVPGLVVQALLAFIFCLLGARRRRQLLSVKPGSPPAL